MQSIFSTLSSSFTRFTHVHVCELLINYFHAVVIHYSHVHWIGFCWSEHRRSHAAVGTEKKIAEDFRGFCSFWFTLLRVNRQREVEKVAASAGVLKRFTWHLRKNGFNPYRWLWTIKHLSNTMYRTRDFTLTRHLMMSAEVLLSGFTEGFCWHVLDYLVALLHHVQLQCLSIT